MQALEECALIKVVVGRALAGGGGPLEREAVLGGVLLVRAVERLVDPLGYLLAQLAE